MAGTPENRREQGPMKVAFIKRAVLTLTMIVAGTTVGAAQGSGVKNIRQGYGGPPELFVKSDLSVAEDAIREVRQYAQISIFDDVSVEVESGVVTLKGKVTMPYKKSEIEKRVTKVGGVREVRNEIGVLPVSSFDDELRYKIARAIYSNPSFWNYAAMANPPIHIIVEHGRVTLTGVVSSNVERMLARSLATGFGELSVTNELRTDLDVRP
jgi:hyperosmotically inducible protein